MNKKIIHELLCSLARQRQPEHNADLDELLGAVPPSDHPYREVGKPGCYQRLLELPSFRWPSKGQPADVPIGSHLFHFRTLEGFLRELNIISDPQRPFPPAANPVINLDKLRERLEALRLTHQPWIPLSAIAEGSYCNKPNSENTRLISWWTDLALEQDNILPDTCKIGIPKNWLDANCVLARCLVDDQIGAQARVPSVLDGFSSEIFLPQAYIDKPSTGRAIDIGSDPFSLGAREVVLGPIPVDRIELRLVQIPKWTPGVSGIDSDEPTFLIKLEQYYRSQLL